MPHRRLHFRSGMGNPPPRLAGQGDGFNLTVSTAKLTPHAFAEGFPVSLHTGVGVGVARLSLLLTCAVKALHGRPISTAPN